MPVYDLMGQTLLDSKEPPVHVTIVSCLITGRRDQRLLTDRLRHELHAGRVVIKTNRMRRQTAIHTDYVVGDDVKKAVQSVIPGYKAAYDPL